MCVVTGHFQSQNIECECGQYMMVVHTCTICPPFIVESRLKNIISCDTLFILKERKKTRVIQPKTAQYMQGEISAAYASHDNQ